MLADMNLRCLVSITQLPLTCALAEGDFLFIGSPPPLFPLGVQSLGWRQKRSPQLSIPAEAECRGARSLHVWVSIRC